MAIAHGANSPVAVLRMPTNSNRAKAPTVVVPSTSAPVESVRRRMSRPARLLRSRTRPATTPSTISAAIRRFAGVPSASKREKR
jgi:hypothetical protein